jgi:hypothetical protein
MRKKTIVALVSGQPSYIDSVKLRIVVSQMKSLKTPGLDVTKLLSNLVQV